MAEKAVENGAGADTTVVGVANVGVEEAEWTATLPRLAEDAGGVAPRIGGRGGKQCETHRFDTEHDVALPPAVAAADDPGRQQSARRCGLRETPVRVAVDVCDGPFGDGLNEVVKLAEVGVADQPDPLETAPLELANQRAQEAVAAVAIVMGEGNRVPVAQHGERLLERRHLGGASERTRRHAGRVRRRLGHLRVRTGERPVRAAVELGRDLTAEDVALEPLQAHAAPPTGEVKEKRKTSQAQVGGVH
jgi:hypothetical protein